MRAHLDIEDCQDEEISTEGASGSEIGQVLERVQTYILKRRVRIKDMFKDFDTLRCGRCTRWQFTRALSQAVPRITQGDMFALVDHFTEGGRNVQDPQDVNYIRFVRDIEAAFVHSDLDKQLQCRVRANILGPDEEERVREVLSRVALLVKTRGIRLRHSFRDCDRSVTMTMVNSRFSGKITPSQFRRHFPLTQYFSEADVNLLVKRYQMDCGGVSFVALDDEIRELSERLDKSRDCESNYETCNSGGVPVTRRRPPSAPLQCSRSESTLLHDAKSKCVNAQRPRSASFCRLTAALQNGQKQLHQDCLQQQQVRQQEQQPLQQQEEQHQERQQQQQQKEQKQEQEQEQEQDQELGQAQEQEYLEKVQNHIRRRLRRLRFSIRSVFADFSRRLGTHITKSQFIRIMDMAGFRLQPKQLEILCYAYCDKDEGRLFNHHAFSADMDVKSSDELIASKQQSAPYTSKQESKYFDSRVVPLYGSQSSAGRAGSRRQQS